MVLRQIPLEGLYYEVEPDTVTLHVENDTESGLASVVFDTAIGIITSGTADADLTNCFVFFEKYAAAGSWADQTGTAIIEFPEWPEDQVNSPLPAGSVLVGALAVMDGNANPTFPTRIVQEPDSPVLNTNGNDKVYGFHYVCDGTECGTKGGANPTTLSITYALSTANVSACLVWEAYSNADIADSTMATNQSTPAAFTHNVPAATAPGGHPVVYCVMGRTSSKTDMFAHGNSTAGVVQRAVDSTVFTTKNNMGGVIYDEQNVPAGATPNRSATTGTGSFTVGIAWALKKVFS